MFVSHFNIRFKIRYGMIALSDGKSSPEPARLQLTMEMLVLQRIDTSSPSPSVSLAPTENKVKFKTKKSICSVMC